MKPILSNTDYNTIKAIINNVPAHLKTKEVGLLQLEIEKADVVNDYELENEIIKLNSYFEVEEVTSRKMIRFTLTLPKHANLSEKKISILSPLGIAVIGFRKGMEIAWPLPGGVKQLKIVEVKHQG